MARVRRERARARLGLPPLDGEGETVETPIGLVPAAGELDTTAWTSPTRRCRTLLTVDEGKLKAELAQVKEHLAKFGDDLPEEVAAQLGSSRRA